MPAYAAFLRGINVTGRRITGADLCAPFEAMGLRDVASFRASGNVVFEADREPAGRLAKRIEKGLEEALGYDVAVFLRTAGEVRAMVEHEPFPRKAVAASAGKLQVTLLPRKPPARAREEVMALATAGDRLAFGERELYWLPSGLTQETELDLDRIDKLLGPTTRRTKGTIEQLAAKYFSG